ncbi:MAG: GIY-YIG nuclease family protein [Rhodobacterales bacterium]|nr:GIY-YIG nuclease family protein [Rhodobacterales bacterium]
MAGKRYYVYVYIDPRNFEEFYYGKGTGDRMRAHLTDTADTEKAKRIRAIKKAGLQPLIRVVARDLTEDQALLVEKTLIWKLGRTLANVASGHFAHNFRPHLTLHQELPGFDFDHGVYFFNIGESKNWIRSWDRCHKHGFICAGHGAKYADAIKGLKRDDIFTAFVSGKRYVGVGRLTQATPPIGQVVINGTPLLAVCPEEGLDADDPIQTEWACTIDWIRGVPRSLAKWKPKSGLFSPRSVRAALDNQPLTVSFIEREFEIPDLMGLAGRRVDSETHES